MSHYAARRAMRRTSSAACRLLIVSFAFILATTFHPTDVEAQALPSGWATSNVGAPAQSGRASYASSTFTLEGGGVDVWDPSDQFYFAHRQVSGDVTIVARVGSVENTHAWAKAGVMIRESLSGNSKHAFALVSRSKGIAFQRRWSTSSASLSTAATGVAPAWVKLERRGSSITASRSTDGTSWTTIGTSTISMGSTVYVGLAVTSHNPSTLATATFTNVSVGGPTGTLPSGWTAADIGSPSVIGSSSASGGTFSVRGAGTNVWGTSDQFQFAYRQLSGDVDVIARVASLSGSDALRKAGVMVRSSLAANSRHVSLFATGGNGIGFFRRPGTGLSTLYTSAGGGAAPIWLKLERRGSAVTAFRSTNGTSWTMIGSDTLTLPSTFYVGLAVTSHVPATAVTGVFTNVTAGAPSSTNTPPTVSLTAPASGATYTAPASVNITATASDADGIASVQFFANGSLIGTDTTSPYSATWSSVPAGTHSITAVARDNPGATTTSAARSIVVNGPTQTPPTVSLTAPASGATFTAPATVSITATASDADGIESVQFFANGSLIGTDTTSPYSATWSSVPAGTHSITARAEDNTGAVTTSAARSIVVSNPTAPPSRAIFEPSADHATSAVTSYRLDVFTAGADPSTATPMATRNLGKPAVVSGECNVDIASTILGLPGGSYFATVVAIGPGGTSARTASPTFTR